MDSSNFLIELSLDEIIKQRKIGLGLERYQKGPVAKNKVQSGSIMSKMQLVDTRTKIIQKNRPEVNDIRGKLTGRLKPVVDARLRLQQKHKNVNSKQRPELRKGVHPAEKLRAYNKQPTTRVRTGLKPQHSIVVPRGYVDYDNMEIEEAVEWPSPYTPLRMTVQNKAASIVLPQHPDSLDCYETPMVHRRSSTVITRQHFKGMDPGTFLPPKKILKSIHRASPPTLYMDRHLDPFKGTSIVCASTGIFGNSVSSSSDGFRVIVSNLHSSVTRDDVKDLFEDIGELSGAKLVRSGVAEVMYKTIADAEKAVGTYHNRKLDGLPMQCMLVKRSTGNNKDEVHVEALHEALFHRH